MQPRRGGRNTLPFRPVGAGCFIAADPAAYAAGNILMSLRDFKSLAINTGYVLCLGASSQRGSGGKKHQAR